MIRPIALAALLLASAPLTWIADSLAQPQPAPSPAEQALGINSWIAQMVQENSNLRAQNATLTQELAAARAKPPVDPAAKIVPAPNATLPQ